MKVARNSTHGLRHDALVASEGESFVSLSTHRNQIHVVVDQNGRRQEFSCSLGALAAALRLVQPREGW